MKIKTFLICYFFIFGLIGNGKEVLGATTNINQELSKEEEEERPTIQSSPYILGPGDIIYLKLLDANEYSGKYVILNDGNINLPLINSVKIEDLTLVEATNKIRALFSKELLRPELYLTLKKSRPVSVMIIGEVERPGIYTFKNENNKNEDSELENFTYNGMNRLINAIQKAGGITSKSDLSSVKLRRKIPGDKIKYKERNVNLKKLFMDGDQRHNPYVFDNDIIKINKKNNSENEIDGFYELAKNNLAPKYITIDIIGEVFNPGELKVRYNTPLIQAILKSGGPKAWRSNKGNVKLVRLNRDGTVTTSKYKIDINQGISNNKNPILQDGDIIDIQTSRIASISDKYQLISTPLNTLINSIQLIKIMND